MVSGTLHSVVSDVCILQGADITGSMTPVIALEVLQMHHSYHAMRTCWLVLGVHCNFDQQQVL
jgi:hypothetical protein